MIGASYFYSPVPVTSNNSKFGCEKSSCCAKQIISCGSNCIRPCYDKASTLYPENPELPYWSAVALAKIGKLDKALPVFSKVFKKDPRLKKMTPRLVDVGLLPKDEDILEKIMNAK